MRNIVRSKSYTVPEGMPRAGEDNRIANHHVPLALLLRVAVWLRSEHDAKALPAMPLQQRLARKSSCIDTRISIVY